MSINCNIYVKYTQDKFRHHDEAAKICVTVTVQEASTFIAVLKLMAQEINDKSQKNDTA